MIKVNKGEITLQGTAMQLGAETCMAVKHVVTTIAKKNKASAAAAFRTLADCMANVAEELVEKFNIPIELLNDDLEKENDEDDDDKLDELLGQLADMLDDLPKDFKKWLLEELVDDDDDEEDD